MIRVSRVANTNASASLPAHVRNCRNAREYGSIEPLMSHSSTIRRARPAPRARAGSGRPRAQRAAPLAAQVDGIAARAQRAAQRPPQVDVLAVAVALRPPRPAHRRRELELASSAGRARASSPGSSASKCLPRRRSSSLATTGTTDTASSDDSPSPGAGEAPPGAPPCAFALAGRSSGTESSCTASSRRVVGERHAAEDVEEHRVERAAPAPGRTPAPRAPSSTAACATPARVSDSASAKRADRSGVTGTPASCRRRPNAVTSSAITPRGSRGRRRGRLPGPRRT